MPSKRVAKDKLPIWPEQVIGGKYVRLLDKFLKQLRSENAHGNRKLFLDDVFVTYLLAFFNPTIRSLRTIEDFSQTMQAQKHLSIRKITKSTLSDFNQIADPERLQPILDALRRQLARKSKRQSAGDDDLDELLQQTVAVDGTFLPAVAEVAWAVCNKNNHGAKKHRARVDVHLPVSTWLPEAIVIPSPGQSEADSAIERLQTGRIYLYDRGFMSFALLAAHYSDSQEPLSQFVARYRPARGNSPTLREVESRKLTDKDKAAGVISDGVGHFKSSNPSRHRVPRVQLREVIVACEEKGKPSQLRLITNLLDVPAHVIAKLYRYRWQVELFFRWLKSYANFGHLISHTSEGVQTHFYVTVIAVLLMYLHTGYRPSKYLFALMGQVGCGVATLEEIVPILRERERQNELARQSTARRREKNKQQAP
ncbi:Putative transposase y4zB [Durusdinium trenchii]|uniref:Transposase y4zB n=1 Tax=Durusdinium trenchii TaxID=1381693 RepID=A0ABP0LE37_9DINO